MAVAYDATGAGASGAASSGSTGTTISWSHTIGASATCLVVGVSAWDNINATAATRSVAVAGTSLTLLAVINNNNAGGQGWVELWGMVGLTGLTGAKTITVNEYQTSNPSSAYPQLAGNSVSYTGVGSIGTAVTNFGSGAGTASTGAITSAAGNMVVGSFSANTSGTAFSALSGTSRVNMAGVGSTNDPLMIQDAAGASTVTLTATTTAAWSAVGVNLSAAAPATPTNLFFEML
jgi:hypothetical protein